MIFDRRFFAFLGLFTQPFKDFTINPQDGLISDGFITLDDDKFMCTIKPHQRKFSLVLQIPGKKILIVKTGACAKVNFLSAQPLFSL